MWPKSGRLERGKSDHAMLADENAASWDKRPGKLTKVKPKPEKRSETRRAVHLGDGCRHRALYGGAHNTVVEGLAATGWTGHAVHHLVAIALARLVHRYQCSRLWSIVHCYGANPPSSHNIWDFGGYLSRQRQLGATHEAAWFVNATIAQSSVYHDARHRRQIGYLASLKSILKPDIADL